MKELITRTEKKKNVAGNHFPTISGGHLSQKFEVYDVLFIFVAVNYEIEG